MSVDDLTIDRWDRQRARQRATDVFDVYQQVFGDVADEARWRAGSFDRHCARDGFRLAAAEAGGVLVGFAYGYVGERGQWWPDQVAAALGPELADVWVGGHFEFVELGVIEPYRRRGIGARLHDELMRGTEDRRALLGTDDTDSPAVMLYRSRQWRKLGNLTPKVAVMGRWVGSQA
jgi:ribosomal protein S18 acetylase RimI-like enzyme